MLGHRTLNAEDYLGILKRRAWLIAIPAVLFTLVGIGVTFLIPGQFVSQTLVLIDQQKVPEDLVRPIVSEDLDSRLASMREQILSRSSIEPIIVKYNLYANQKITMDARVDLARKSIDIKPIHSDIARSNGLPGFFISFVASDPQTAQQVCREITSLFTGANLRSREATAEGTTAFFREQLDTAKHTLDDQASKLAAFQRQYTGMLPSDKGDNINMLTTLNTQLASVTQSLQTMVESQSVLQAMLSGQQSQSVSSTAQVVQSPQAQEKELQELEAQEADLAAHYTDQYPAVKAVRRKIADLRKEMAQEPTAPAVTSLPATPTRDSASVQQLKAQLRGYELAVAAKRKQQDDLEKQIHLYQSRIEAIPQVEEQFTQLNRDTLTSQTFYDNLRAKMEQSQMATDLEHRQQGEQFRLMDDANLPDGPIFPKKSVFAGGGFAAGFAIGLLIAALLEYKDTALRTERDVWAFTQLPTLAVIAWSGEVAEVKLRKRDRLKRLFSRKQPKDQLADAPG